MNLSIRTASTRIDSHELLYFRNARLIDIRLHSTHFPGALRGIYLSTESSTGKSQALVAEEAFLQEYDIRVYHIDMQFTSNI